MGYKSINRSSKPASFQGTKNTNNNKQVEYLTIAVKNDPDASELTKSGFRITVPKNTLPREEPDTKLSRREQIIRNLQQ